MLIIVNHRFHNRKVEVDARFSRGTLVRTRSDRRPGSWGSGADWNAGHIRRLDEQ